MAVEQVVTFRLYVAGHLPNSSRAVSNLRAFCETQLSSGYSIDVLDVLENPDAALSESIFMTPQLVVQSGTGKHVLIGDLSDASRLAQLLADGP
ncbi:circadian clock KaiB family protein [Lutimaribacter sp. EGI FJ00015]|uniref:circadian clock KaiB family protein n=1 Tax=Lutimaribacter degradans TaxID=2945989 RepID=UPI00207CBF50|nr:circadian clock KaiB family protein [Lutimaribacter sp. EGI FJ00015]